MSSNKIQEFSSEIEDMLSSEISIDRQYTKEVQSLLVNSKPNLVLDDSIVALFISYANPFNLAEIDLGSNLPIFAKKAIFTAYYKFLFTEDFESTHRMLVGVSSAIQHKIQHKLIKDILEFEVRRVHAMGFFKEGKFAQAIKYLNPAVASCPVIGGSFGSGLSDALVLLAESYSALGRRDDALHSARLAVNISHERLERFNKDPTFALKHRDLLDFEGHVLDSFTSLILAYCALASELEKSGMAHLATDWYHRAFQAAVKFQLDKQVLSELEKLLDMSRALHAPPSSSSQPNNAFSSSHPRSSHSPYRPVVSESDAPGLLLEPLDAANRSRPKSALPRMLQDCDSARDSAVTESRPSQEDTSVEVAECPKSLLKQSLSAAPPAGRAARPPAHPPLIQFPGNAPQYASATDLLAEKRMVSSVSTPVLLPLPLGGQSIILMPSPPRRLQQSSVDPQRNKHASSSSSSSSQSQLREQDKPLAASDLRGEREPNPTMSSSASSAKQLKGVLAALAGASKFKRGIAQSPTSKDKDAQAAITRVNKTALSKAIQRNVLDASKEKTTKALASATPAPPRPATAATPPGIPAAYLHLDEFGKDKLKRVSELYVPYFKGLKVEACYQMRRMGGTRRWYPGRIVHADFARGLYEIEFENGDREKNIFVDDIRIPEHESKQALFAKSNQIIKTLPRRKEQDEENDEEKVVGKKEKTPTAEHIPARVIRNQNAEEMHKVVMRMMSSINQRTVLRKSERLQIKHAAITKVQALIRGVLCRIRAPQRLRSLQREKSLRERERELVALEEELRRSVRAAQESERLQAQLQRRAFDEEEEEALEQQRLQAANMEAEREREKERESRIVTFAEAQTGLSLVDTEPMMRDDSLHGALLLQGVLEEEGDEELPGNGRIIEEEEDDDDERVRAGEAAMDREQSFNFMLSGEQSPSSFLFAGEALSSLSRYQPYPPNTPYSHVDFYPQHPYAAGAASFSAEPVELETNNSNDIEAAQLQAVRDLLASMDAQQKEREFQREEQFAQEVGELREAFLAQREELHRLQREEEAKRRSLERQVGELLRQREREDAKRAQREATARQHSPPSTASPHNEDAALSEPSRVFVAEDDAEKGMLNAMDREDDAFDTLGSSVEYLVVGEAMSQSHVDNVSPTPDNDNPALQFPSKFSFSDALLLDDPAENAKHANTQGEEDGLQAEPSAFQLPDGVEEFWNSVSSADFSASARPSAVHRDEDGSGPVHVPEQSLDSQVLGGSLFFGSHSEVRDVPAESVPSRHSSIDGAPLLEHVDEPVPPTNKKSEQLAEITKHAAHSLAEELVASQMELLLSPKSSSAKKIPLENVPATPVVVPEENERRLSEFLSVSPEASMTLVMDSSSINRGGENEENEMDRTALSLSFAEARVANGGEELSKAQRDAVLVDWLGGLWTALLDWTLQRIFNSIALTVAAEKVVIGMRRSHSALPATTPLKHEFSALLKDLAFEDEAEQPSHEISEPKTTLKKSHSTLAMDALLAQHSPSARDSLEHSQRWADKFTEHMHYGRKLFEDAQHSIGEIVAVAKDELGEENAASLSICEDLVSTMRELANQDFHAFFSSHVLWAPLPSSASDSIDDFKPSDVNPYLVSALQSNWSSKWWLDIERRLVSFFACFQSDIAGDREIMFAIKDKLYRALRDVLRRAEEHSWESFWKARENCRLMITQESLSQIIAKAESIMYAPVVSANSSGHGRDLLVSPVKLSRPRDACNASSVIALINKIVHRQTENQ